MDLDLSPTELDALRAVAAIVEEAGGSETLLRLSSDNMVDDRLEQRLRDDILAGEASLVVRTLVVEEAARLGLPVALGPAAILGPELRGVIAQGARLAVGRANAQDPVRFADIAATFVLLTDGQVTIAGASDVICEPVATSVSYSYARVRPENGAVAPVDVDFGLARRRWALALCAELSGNLRGGLELTTEHLRHRVQFGHPLASFQALRHRVSEATVDVESVSWLTRRAAYDDDSTSLLNAAVQAEAVASRLVGELSQLVGARAFVTEFGLHVWTMRAAALRAELTSWLSAYTSLGSPVPAIGEELAR